MHGTFTGVNSQHMKKRFFYNGYCIAAIAFVAAFAFFLFAYPYHLMHREQLDLFLYDWDYIRKTYTGNAWLARFVTDFLEQFFCLKVAGALVIALILTAIGSVSYRICRKFLKKLPSYIIAALVFGWAFMRETGNLYSTRYTVVVLGYLSVILAAMQFDKIWSKAASSVILICISIWALGSPVHKNYGQLWNTPLFDYERLIGLDAEVANENWDKVMKLSKKDLYMREASYCYNLALGMKGELGNRFFEHSQGTAYDLLLFVSSENAVFVNTMAGEAWYQLGNMTIAEQSAITSLQASPNHTGARFIKRLAIVSLVKGDEAAAQKYLKMLSKTLFYRRWALKMMPGRQDETTKAWIQKKRSLMADTDFVHLSNVPRAILQGMLKTDPDNTMAREYLLLYDLLRYDIDQFMEDYLPDMIDGQIYHEAVLINLAQQGRLRDEDAAEYGISPSLLNKMDSFARFPDRYKSSYWYYFLTD